MLCDEEMEGLFTMKMKIQYVYSEFRKFSDQFKVRLVYYIDAHYRNQDFFCELVKKNQINYITSIT